MADIKLTFPAEIREFLAATIARAGGNEVYFLARVEWEESDLARVEEVDVLARGNSGAAPAIIQGAEEWDLAIHNHPGGDLSPSDADLNVASELGNREVGFAIIDSQAREHYLVVPPFHREPGSREVDSREIDEIFAPGGPLSQGLEYEARPGQLAMALEVTEALNSDRVVAIEAGTGVGKGFAYLVPAILWAVRNKRRIVVSTNTINLQEQLVGKDLPYLERVLPIKFRHALIKGRSNYACKRKLMEAKAEVAGTLLETDDEVRQLRELVAWAETAREGSLAELGTQPAEHVWDKVMSETDKSLKVNCQFYGECFYYQSRRIASRANIVVVNHHLFFADLAVRRAVGDYNLDLVIPGYQRVIFDEAHHLEDVASQHLGVRVSQQGIRSRFGRLRSRKDPGKGALPFLVNRLRQEGALAAANVLEKGLLADLSAVAEKIEAHLDLARDLVEEEARRVAPTGSSPGEADHGTHYCHVRITEDPEQYTFKKELGELLRSAGEELGILQAQAKRAIEAVELAGNLQGERREGLKLELTSLVGRLSGLLEDIQFFLNFEDPSQARWAEVRGRRHDRGTVVFAAAPVRVGEELKTAVYDPLRTVVMTSATLSVAGNVQYLGERLGLDRVEPERFHFSRQPSPFDYARQVLTLLPTDFPDPGEASFGDRVAETVLEILQSTRGRAFVLFTAYGLLNRTFQTLEQPLRAEGICPLRQGDTGRSELLRRFCSGPPHALFGTDSFWEGVDVKGKALSCVIITRLPFRVPSDPLQQARVEDLERSGKNSFTSLTVPQAVLKFKQGFGRLIRSTTDRGVVVVLDRRIITRPYGKAFLEALPPARRVQCSRQEVRKLIDEFFETGPELRTISTIPSSGGAVRKKQPRDHENR